MNPSTAVSTGSGLPSNYYVSISGNAITAISGATPAVFTCTSTVGFEVGQPIYFVGTMPTATTLASVAWGATTTGAGAPIAATVAGTTYTQPGTYYIASILSRTTFTIAANPYGFSSFGCATGASGLTGLYVVQKDFYAQQTPSFLMGINLDTMYQATNNSMCGINTNSGNVFLNATYSAPTPNSVTVGSVTLAAGQRFDAWAHYDFLILIDPRSKQMSIRI